MTKVLNQAESSYNPTLNEQKMLEDGQVRLEKELEVIYQRLGEVRVNLKEKETSLSYLETKITSTKQHIEELEATPTLCPMDV
ncbi:hypothetical protein RDABS01_031278 [Bienertia sinuspersici]